MFQPSELSLNDDIKMPISPYDYWKINRCAPYPLDCCDGCHSMDPKHWEKLEDIIE